MGLAGLPGLRVVLAVVALLELDRLRTVLTLPVRGLVGRRLRCRVSTLLGRSLLRGSGQRPILATVGRLSR